MSEILYHGNAFGDLTQPELLERLQSGGITISSQTLRYWESNKLITPPIRGAGFGGKWSRYSEYVLIECYAAHMLLSVLPKNRPNHYFPKFTLEMLANARRSCPYHPTGLPPKPVDAAIIEKTGLTVSICDEYIATLDEMLIAENQHLDNSDDSTMKSVPLASSWDEVPPSSLNLSIQRFMSSSNSHSFENNLLFFLEKSAQLLWFKYLCKGATIFWSSKK